ncbi:hypothetical protein PACTADRAFT_42788 [Pachysolen tannophilus NRRL Y-2460]|uniref:Major facilitator superfamily (MFS) profile domain-containing protein n=1 Tax=Pachysolen tannophilus NRRL Y-2460 TaxID=669874 RepID=A0A1E4TTY4_PACTA|nr:hypothetical protein PACTADRAFT_42788 [Pachysolen tannophilus NRRL Y-2460]
MDSQYSRDSLDKTQQVDDGYENNHNGGLSPPDFSSVTIKHYLKTRFTELIPTVEEIKSKRHLVNPFPPLKNMTWKQWSFFGVSFWSWTLDSFDYFAVSLNVSNLSKTFDVSTADITWGITLVLMLRSVGAIIFGVLSDRYGRKWPLISNLILLSILQIATGFVNTYKQFLGVRSLFGIAMGGLYGNVAATALEDAPSDARGILSGLLQEGYAFGYLLAVVFQRALADTTSKGWRSMFWFSAGVTLIFIVWRMLLPETNTYKRQKALSEKSGSASKIFIQQAKSSIKIYWLICIYLVILMAGFNFMSHGSQDLYPTLLDVQLGFSTDASTVTNSVANLGAFTGGIFIGYISEFIGRRLSIIICCILGGAMIYPWAFLTGSGINAGCFFLQFMVQGAWGVIPIHLSELAPAHFRSFIVGTSYQLGNLCSSASSTIEATIGERFPLYDSNGNKENGVYNYAKVMSIFMGCVFAFVLLVALFGPENKGANIAMDTIIDKDFKNDEEAQLDEEKEQTEYEELVYNNEEGDEVDECESNESQVGKAVQLN